MYVEAPIFNGHIFANIRVYKQLRPHLRPPFNSLQLHGIECLYTTMAAKTAAKEDLCYRLLWIELVL